MWHSRAQGCAGTGRGGDAKRYVFVYGYIWDCVTVTLFDCVTEVCDQDVKIV